MDEIDVFTKGALQICKGLEIRLQMDKSGQISGISNFARCQKFIDSAYAVVAGMAPADQKINKSDLSLMIQPSIASWDVFIATYCQEINQFFFISGVALESNQEYSFPTEIPNPFEGPNFPATSVIKLDNIKENVANISMNTIVKPKDMDLVMKETFKIIEKQGGEPFDNKDMPKMKMGYKDFYKYDVKAALIREMYEEKRMVAGPKKKTTTMRIKLLDK